MMARKQTIVRNNSQYCFYCCQCRIFQEPIPLSCHFRWVPSLSISLDERKQNAWKYFPLLCPLYLSSALNLEDYEEIISWFSHPWSEVDMLVAGYNSPGEELKHFLFLFPTGFDRKSKLWIGLKDGKDISWTPWWHQDIFMCKLRYCAHEPIWTYEHQIHGFDRESFPI